MKEIFTAIAFAVLLTAVPALAADTSTNNKPASSISSGPGVKGAPGNKNGPAAQPNSMDKAGSSSGTAYTQPSQDAKGVKGAPGNKSGPAEKSYHRKVIFSRFRVNSRPGPRPLSSAEGYSLSEN